MKDSLKLVELNENEPEELKCPACDSTELVVTEASFAKTGAAIQVACRNCGRFNTACFGEFWTWVR